MVINSLIFKCSDDSSEHTAISEDFDQCIDMERYMEVDVVSEYGR